MPRSRAKNVSVRVEPEILQMQITDVPRVHDIESLVFPDPWSIDSFLAEVERKSTVGYSIVMRDADEIVGYAVAWFIVDEIHIGNIAVAPAAQRQGIGRRLLEFCLHDAASRGIEYATLEVRVSNDRAIKLYETFGFRPVAMRRGYYSDTGEDALVMMREFGAGRRGAR